MTSDLEKSALQQRLAEAFRREYELGTLATPTDPTHWSNRCARIAAEEIEKARGACALHARRGYCDSEAWFKGKGEGYAEAIEELYEDARMDAARKVRDHTVKLLESLVMSCCAPECWRKVEQVEIRLKGMDDADLARIIGADGHVNATKEQGGGEAQDNASGESTLEVVERPLLYACNACNSTINGGCVHAWFAIALKGEP